MLYPNGQTKDLAKAGSQELAVLSKQVERGEVKELHLTAGQAHSSWHPGAQPLQAPQGVRSMTVFHAAGSGQSVARTTRNPTDQAIADALAGLSAGHITAINLRGHNS